MALFKPWTGWSDVPPRGSIIEHHSLDAKETYRPRDGGKIDKAEIAKDVAAFANLNGGVILIGAVEEKKTGTLGAFKTMSDGEAEAHRTAVSEAIRDNCSPRPLVEPVRIECPDGSGYLVAVNVWAFPGAPVGVMVAPDVYKFPLRAVKDCAYLSPEQLPMLMLADLRRAAILLDSIPEAERSPVTLYAWILTTSPREYHPKPYEAAFKGVDIRNNVATFDVLPESREPVHIPLDAIDTAWKDGPKWRVSLRPGCRLQKGDNVLRYVGAGPSPGR